MILPGDSGVADGGGGVTLARTAPSAVWLAPTANWATMTTTTTATQAATAAPVPEDRVVGVRSGAGRAGIEARPATQPPTRARAGSCQSKSTAAATAKATTPAVAHEERRSRRLMAMITPAPVATNRSTPVTPPSARTVRYMSGTNPG